MSTQGWRHCKLGDVITLKRGYDLPKKQRQSGIYPIVSSSGITDYHIEAKVKGPGVVTGRYGTLGEVFFVEQDFWPLNTSLYVQNFKKNEPRFISYLLKQLNLGTRNAAGAVPGVNRNHLHMMDVACPPLPLQHRIAGILSAYDDLIENNQRRIRILEDMARALYREWFVEFRFPGHESVRFVDSPLGKIPDGWEVKQVKDFGKVITGKTPSKANPAFFGVDVPFVKTPDMHGNLFILSTTEGLSTAGAESQANKTLPPGSLCVSCIGTIGVVSVATEACQTNQQINSVVFFKPECREFLFFSIQNSRKRLENLGSTGATMGNVNKGKFESLEIIAPPDDLLNFYHQLVEQMFLQVHTLQLQSENLRRTRDLLLPRLLSGQLDVSKVEQGDEIAV